MAGLADFSPPSSSVLPWLKAQDKSRFRKAPTEAPLPVSCASNETAASWHPLRLRERSSGETAEGDALVRNLLKKGDSHPAPSGGFHDQIKYPEMRMLWSRSCPPTPLASAPCSYPLLLCASTRVHQAMSWTKLKDQWLWIGSLNRDSIQ